jgi:hypothetical protein
MSTGQLLRSATGCSPTSNAFAGDACVTSIHRSIHRDDGRFEGYMPVIRSLQTVKKKKTKKKKAPHTTIINGASQ